MAREEAPDPARLANVLKGLRAYQEAPRIAAQQPAEAVAAKAGATLRDYGGSGPPIIFIPSLINPPNVLDLSVENSLLRWLSKQGHRVLLIDWGWDVEARRSLDVAGHVEEVIAPFIDAVGGSPSLVGYCLGGTMAVAAAATRRVGAVATIAAPWRFSAFGHREREMLLALWERSKPAAEALGVLPMEVLQSAFWSLDPGRTVSKFERFAALDPGSPEAKAFVLLEDWANDGPPVGQAAAREMFEDFFGDDLPGIGRWRVNGKNVDPATLPCPLLNIVSETDRIVPFASAIPAGERIALARGHVGMVVGSHARQRLWEPLARWLSKVTSS